MAKSKKPSTEDKTEKKLVKRGRPSTKKESKTINPNDDSETFYTRTYRDGRIEKFSIEEYENKIYPELTKQEQEVQDSENKQNTEKSEIDVLIEKIYDNPLPIGVQPFPTTDIKTQTKTLIDNNKIDQSKLPQEIVDSINDLLVDFNVFLSNTMNVGIIPTVMEKDAKSYNLLNDWVTKRKEFIDKLNPQIKEPTFVPPAIASNPQNSSFNASAQNININQQSGIFRQAGSTYFHNPTATSSQSHALSNSHIPSTENKNIHVEMTMKSIERQQKFNEQTRNGILSQKPEIDKEKYLNDYSNTIMGQINNTFQMIHWKYIPMDTLKTLLNNCDKSLNYEVYDCGDASYIKITDGVFVFESPKFAIK